MPLCSFKSNSALSNRDRLAAELRILVLLLVAGDSRQRLLLGGVWEVRCLVLRRRSGPCCCGGRVLHHRRWLRGSGGTGDRRISTASGSDVFLRLARVLAGVFLHSTCDLRGVLVGEILDLARLGVRNVLSIGQVLVDELLVVHVDQRGEEDDGGADEAETPKGDDLEKEVCEEGGHASRESVDDVLGE